MARLTRGGVGGTAEQGQDFGHYRLERLIGSGGMGDVYQAFDRQRERVVALKLLPELFSANQEFEKRFRRESRVAARLREPHIIPIHDFGEIDGRLYIDMRLVDGGQSIASLLRDLGPLPPARAVRLISQVADALDAAHADGLIHRDVKPSNILVTGQDFIYVVDFGIAHAIGHTASALTMTGTTVGTLEYMAPERFKGTKIDRGADVYSLACVLYECLTGRKPFPGEDLPALMYAHLFTPPRRPSAVAPAVPPALDEAVARGMAKEADRRYPTAGALAEAARRAVGDTSVGEPADPPARPTAAGPPGRAPEQAGSVATVAAPGPGAPTKQVEQPAPTKQVEQPGKPEEPRSPADAEGAEHASHTQEPRGSHRAEAPTESLSVSTTRPVTSPALPAPASSLAPPPVGQRRTRLWGPLTLAALLAVGIMAVLMVSHQPSVRSQTPAPARTPVPPAIKASVAVPTLGPSIPTAATPGFAAVAPNGRFAYVANRDPRLISVLDTVTNQITATIPLPAGPPHFVAFTKDSARAYVAIYDDQDRVNLVAVLDTATNRVLATVPVDKRPFALAVAPDQHTVWVSSHDTGLLDVLDTASNAVTKRMRVPPNPHWLAFDDADNRLYVADHESNVLSVVDPSRYAVVATIPVGTSPHSVAVSPDGHRVSVVNFDSNNISVVDTATNRVVATIPVGRNPQYLAYSPDGRFAYTANVDDGTVSVIDMTRNVVTANIPIGGSPTSIALLPDGSRGYVTSLDFNKLTIMNTAG